MLKKAEARMLPFKYQRAESVDAALAGIGQHAAKFIAGGTNLLDLMKGQVEQPAYLIDITHLPFAQIEPRADGGVRIGALVPNSDTANHPLIRKYYPLLTQALVAGASPQLRNKATVGGNLLQRTRCGYFMDPAFSACNKRAPGSGCGARAGHHHNHAIFGASEACVAVNPSDMSVALAALDAQIFVRGANGERVIPIADFHRLPEDRPPQDTNLANDEIILAVELPPSPFAQHAYYLKLRERSSYAFALVSVAVALAIDGGSVRDARVVAGGVAHKPWRLFAVENALRGKAVAKLDYGRIGALAVQDAQPLEQNRYKVPLLEAAVPRAIQRAGGAA
jgi:xanthine dehydrogenase YagS FAD-binding subunit